MRPSSIWYPAHPLRLSHSGGKSLFPKELTELCEAALQKRLRKEVERKGAMEHTYSNPLGSGHPRTQRKILRVPGPASSKPDLVYVACQRVQGEEMQGFAIHQMHAEILNFHTEYLQTQQFV